MPNSSKNNPQDNTAAFKFFGKTNDFLPLQKRKKWFECPFRGNPAIKDTIESLGVPHVEVAAIAVNGRLKTFSYHLKNGDRVRVFSQSKMISGKNPRFILDSHLGKLARYLRLLGFDTLYDRNVTDRQIVENVRKSRRIVLTRDIGLLKNKIITKGYWVREVIPSRQLKEIASRFALAKKKKPFHVCLECNGKIMAVPQRKVAPFLALDTLQYFRRFFMCANCKKIYWQGSHYVKLLNVVRSLTALPTGQAGVRQV